MDVRVLIGATALLAAVLGPAAPGGAADVVNLGARVTVGHVQGDSGTAIVQQASGAPVAAIELWYRAPSAGFEATPLPSLSRLAAQVVAASKPLVGPSLGEAVNAAGGKLAITAYGNSVAISALVPSDAAASIVKAMTVAYFSPVVTSDGFKTATRDVVTDALFASFDPQTTVRDAAFAELFPSGPQHYGALGTPKEIEAISFDSVRAFATRAFRAQNAVFVVSGAVDSTILDAASKGRPAGTDVASAAAPEPASASQPSSAAGGVSKPFDERGGGFAWVGPPITDERAATAMDFIADYLFRPETGILAREVAASHPGSNFLGQFVTLHDPGVMFVSFSGVGIDDVRVSLERDFTALRGPLATDVFNHARDAFEYHILSDLQTPSELADNFGWYAIEGNLSYAPGANGVAGAYFDAARSLTPAYVAGVANHYLSKAPVSVTLVPEPEPKGQARGAAQP
jgi:predicted Zn-dependent peptidase